MGLMMSDRGTSGKKTLAGPNHTLRVQHAPPRVTSITLALCRPSYPCRLAMTSSFLRRRRHQQMGGSESGQLGNRALWMQAN